MTFTSTSPVPVYSLTTLHQDLFTRANTSEPVAGVPAFAIGGPDIGSPWIMYGPSFDATPSVGYIQDNKFTTSVAGSAATVYLANQLGATPRMVQLKGSWNSGGGAGAAASFTVRIGLTHVNENWGVAACHVRLQTAAILIDSLAAVTGDLTNRLTQAISALTTAGQEHIWNIYLYPEVGTVDVYVDGVLRATVTHNDFKDEAGGGLVGPFVYWQIYYGAADSTLKGYLTGATAYSSGNGFVEAVPVAKSNSTTFDNTSPVEIAQP